MIDTTTQMAVASALNKILTQSYFDICTIDKCAEALNIRVKDKQEYKILSTLHCVNYGQMPRELRSQLPKLIAECLEIQLTDSKKEEDNNWFRRLISELKHNT